MRLNKAQSELVDLTARAWEAEQSPEFKVDVPPWAMQKRILDLNDEADRLRQHVRTLAAEVRAWRARSRWRQSTLTCMRGHPSSFEEIGQPCPVCMAMDDTNESRALGTEAAK